MYILFSTARPLGCGPKFAPTGDWNLSFLYLSPEVWFGLYYVLTETPNAYSKHYLFFDLSLHPVAELSLLLGHPFLCFELV